MPLKLSRRRRTRLMRDIMSSRYDLVQLSDTHRLPPEALAEWIGDADNYRALQSLSVLAEVQTQLLLSRYRSLAAGRLMDLTRDDRPAEVARKACVDMLKMNTRVAMEAKEMMMATAREDPVSDAFVRRLLYDDTDALLTNAATHGDEACHSQPR